MQKEILDEIISLSEEIGKLKNKVAFVSDEKEITKISIAINELNNLRRKIINEEPRDGN